MQQNLFLKKPKISKFGIVVTNRKNMLFLCFCLELKNKTKIIQYMMLLLSQFLTSVNYFAPRMFIYLYT